MKTSPSPSLLSMFHKHREEFKKHFKFSSSLPRNNNNFFLPHPSPIENSFFSSSSTSNPLPTLQGTVLMIIFSFVLAEFLSFFGLFQDSSGIQDQERARRFGTSWFDKENDSHAEFKEDDWDDHLDRAILSFRTWIRRSRKKGGFFHLPTWKKRLLGISEACSLFGVYDTLHAVLSFKHQFAIGCSIGMIFHPVAKTIMNIGLGTYVLSEIIHNIKRTGEDLREHEETTYIYSSDDDEDDNKFYEKLDKPGELSVAYDSFCTSVQELFHRLDQFRLAVRKRIFAVGQPLENDHFWNMDDSEGTILVGAIIGIILKSFM